MVKISAISQKLIPNIRKLNNKFDNGISANSMGAMTIPLASGGFIAGGFISDKCKNFFKTVDNK